MREKAWRKACVQRREKQAVYKMVKMGGIETTIKQKEKQRSARNIIFV